MKHTLYDILSNQIAAYHPFGVDDGLYLATFEDGAQIEIWSCDDDPAPTCLPNSEWHTLPADGWLHRDDCTCPECEE